MRTRPDAYWYGKHPSICSLHRESYAHQYSGDIDKLGRIDHHFVLPRDAAEAIFSGMIQSYKSCHEPFVLPNLETWLFNSLKSSPRKLRRFNFPHVVVRFREREGFHYCVWAGF